MTNLIHPVPSKRSDKVFIKIYAGAVILYLVLIKIASLFFKH